MNSHWRTALFRRLIAAAIFLSTGMFPASGLPPDSVKVAGILDHLRDRFNKIRDYSVEMEVSFDMPGLRMPRKKMTFTFKQPDMTRLEAVGFAMLPRRGMTLSPDTLFEELQGLQAGTDTLLEGRPTAVLKGQETTDRDEVVSVELYVDREWWVIVGLSTFLSGNELFKVRTDFQEVAPGLHMPRETRLEFNLEENPFSRRRHGRRRSDDPDNDAPDLPQVPQQVTADSLSKAHSGTAVIRFSKYRINQGIPDEFFDEDRED